MNAYDFKVKTMSGGEVSLADYMGKVLLIVNTATACGFTPQYKELQEIYDAYKALDFEILDFPCNQFGAQAPGSDEEIHTFCTGRFGITFPQLAKIDVNGEGADPLFRWLTGSTKFSGFDKNPMGLMLDSMLKKQDPDYASTDTVKWNFTKFLIDRRGNVAARFEPMTAMKTVRAKIAETL